MRKQITGGLLALSLSFLTSSVFAGTVQVCEDIKNDPDYKGLYGLCNAYWNETDEALRTDILEAFKVKAGPGGPSMPGLEEASCPCWDQAYLASTITGGLEGIFCEIDNTGQGSDFVFYMSNPATLLLEAGFLAGDPFAGSTGCILGGASYPMPDGVVNSWPVPTDAEEDAECSRLLREAMQAENFSYDCGQWPVQ